MTSPILATSTQNLGNRRLTESDRRQGLVGWVIYSDEIGVIPRLFRRLELAERELNKLVHLHRPRVLGVHQTGRTYDHVCGRLTQHAYTCEGMPICVRLRGRRLWKSVTRRPQRAWRG